ncbi:hypothetical protein C2G38_2168246 [Gigaspora rosea]|uniref:Uncharacterized protein n=1 Tax=Gigaspora rosea TaxID=44941 RepID=A0A397VRM3_9GLOM|nr:hypothetical protein C2G38_2168246 [Gigaspora rosea]
MASKIFIGDIPEIMEKILNNLNNEFDSLYSCLYSFPTTSHLEEDEKFILNECGINVEISKTLFDYARFLKVLDLLCLKTAYNEYFFDETNSEIFYSLGQNEQLFSQLQDLTLSVMSNFNTENATNLLRIMAKSATKIDALKLTRFCSDDDPQLFHLLIRIIKSQEI